MRLCAMAPTHSADESRPPLRLTLSTLAHLQVTKQLNMARADQTRREHQHLKVRQKGPS